MNSSTSKFCHKKKKWEEPYQLLPDSPDMYDVADQDNSEKDVDTYDEFFGPEICLPDKRGRKIMSRVTKRVKENKGNTIGIEHLTLFVDNSLY